ncbi:hypothetical protein G9A89_002320 [Geosiphon pyriformis]|nr:hypothetical protein G9A89_002320 [Geosiphon pyriformis]
MTSTENTENISPSSIKIEDSVSSRATPTKPDWWSRQVNAYKAVALKEKWFNPDGNVLPVTVENLCRFMEVKSYTNNPTSINWYVKGIAKYHTELNIGNGEAIQNHPDVIKLKEKIKKEYEDLVAEIGGDPKKIKNLEKKVLLQQVAAKKAGEVPTLNLEVSKPLSQSRSMESDIFEETYAPLDLRNEQHPARGVLIYLGCWTALSTPYITAADEQEFQHELYMSKLHQKNMTFLQDRAIWGHMRDDENYQVPLSNESDPSATQKREPLLITANQQLHFEMPRPTLVPVTLPKKKEQSRTPQEHDYHYNAIQLASSDTPMAYTKKPVWRVTPHYKFKAQNIATSPSSKESTPSQYEQLMTTDTLKNRFNGANPFPGNFVFVQQEDDFQVVPITPHLNCGNKSSEMILAKSKDNSHKLVESEESIDE